METHKVIDFLMVSMRHLMNVHKNLFSEMRSEKSQEINCLNQ
jgi:hypothetical protein